MSSKRFSTAAALGAVLAFSAAAPALAQEVDDRYRERGPILFVSGGGFSALRDVTQTGLSFDNGYSFGGGFGYQLNRYVALRANLSYTSSQIDESTIANANDQFSNAAAARDFHKYFYGADFQIRYPTDSGLAPTW